MILYGKPLRLELIYINILGKKELNLQIHNRVKKNIKKKLNQKIKYPAISSDYFQCAKFLLDLKALIKNYPNMLKIH